jgi:hypothetical protein
MPDRQPSLDQQTIDILLSVIETPHAMITSAALDGFYAAKAPALTASGLLELKDHRRAAVSLADHDDEPVNLSWSPEHRGYGYFSPSAGWVPVSDGQMASFGISFEKLFEHLLERLDLSTRALPTVLLPDLLWEIGEVRLPGRGKRVPLWIGRRLADPKVWSRFAETVRARPAPGLRIVLSLTPADRLPAQIHQGHSIIAVRDIVDHASGLVVNPQLLAARVASGAPSADAFITMGADGASVTVRGTRYAFSGSKQRALIRQLYEAWQSGSPECLTAEVLENAEYSDSVNTINKAFSGRTDWRDFIKEEHGRCWMFH